MRVFFLIAVLSFVAACGSSTDKSRSSLTDATDPAIKSEFDAVVMKLKDLGIKVTVGPDLADDRGMHKVTAAFNAHEQDFLKQLKNIKELNHEVSINFQYYANGWKLDSVPHQYYGKPIRWRMSLYFPLGERHGNVDDVPWSVSLSRYITLAESLSQYSLRAGAHNDITTGENILPKMQASDFDYLIESMPSIIEAISEDYGSKNPKVYPEGTLVLGSMKDVLSLRGDSRSKFFDFEVNVLAAGVPGLKALVDRNYSYFRVSTEN